MLTATNSTSANYTIPSTVQTASTGSKSSLRSPRRKIKARYVGSSRTRPEEYLLIGEGRGSESDFGVVEVDGCRTASDFEIVQ